METKKKKLGMLPTLKEKRHYLIIEIKIQRQDARKAIEDSLLKFLGILNYANAGPQIISAESKNNMSYIILSVKTKYVDAAKAAIALIKEGMPRCIGVSGTIKKLREKFAR